MGKVWVLDTETKGTGAHVVPLEDVLAKPAAKRRRNPFERKAGPDAGEPAGPPAPRPPQRFKVVDVMTGLVVSEDVGTRETLDVLKRFRSVVDVDILVWDRPFERWQRLSMRDKRALWKFREERDER